MCYQKKIPFTRWVTDELGPPVVAEFVARHTPRLRLSVTVGREARKWMNAPADAAGAVAYLLMSAGYGVDTVREFMAPGVSTFSRATVHMASDDPRAGMARIIRVHAADNRTHHIYECVGYLLTAWSLWSAGSTGVVTWDPVKAPWPPTIRPAVQADTAS